MRVIRFVCLSMYCIAGVHLYAQFLDNKPATSEFRGRVVDGPYSSYDDLVVEVTNLRDRTIRERADVTADGSFGFRQLPTGDYEVHVSTLYGTELISTVESITPGAAPMEIRLGQSKLQRPPSGTVSIQQLTHPPSKQVRKLLDSGQRLFHAQHYDDAVARFSEAAKDDPDCPEAHADLGLAMTKTGDWTDAVAEYRTAVNLDPSNSILHSNLSAALAVQQRYEEAKREAWTALKLDPRNARAHYVIGAILLRTQGPTAAAVSHLLASQESFPSVKETVTSLCAANRVETCP